MQTREKQLGLGFAGVLGVLVVWNVLKPWYFGPIEQQQAELARVKGDLSAAETQQMQLLQATRRLADWKARSLPPDPKRPGRQRPDALNGQRLYQEWLTDLARHCGFIQTEVTPGLTRSFQDVYVTAQVRIKAQAKYGQICDFLALFEQTELLQRIESCHITCNAHRGDPDMEVNLVAEGVALIDAPQRDLLFPQTVLASSIAADGGKLTVKDAEGFPEGGRFIVRIGKERLAVSYAKGTAWTVTRAKNETKPAPHAAGTKVDLGLFNPLATDEPSRDRHPKFAMISQQNPFTIPPPKIDVPPALNVAGEQYVYLGSPLQFEANATGVNAAHGAPKFELQGSVPAGMKIEPSGGNPLIGVVTWQPADEKLLGEHPVTIQMTRGDFARPITKQVVVIVEKENFSPSLANVDAQVVYSGQPLAFTAKAADANEDQHLTYSLGAGAPADAVIDPATGQFTWTPPGPVTEQSFDVEILATDDGRPPKAASLKVPVTVKTDVAMFTRFVGAVADTAASEAWLFDRWNKRDLYVKVGETLQVADISAQLMKIDGDVVYFRRDGQTWRLELGQDLRNMKPVAEPSKTARAN